MTPGEMAALHKAAFLNETPWSEKSFAELVESPHVSAFARTEGFALTRTVAGESELLTLAVHPDHQRQGIAKDLMNVWLRFARNHAETAFLEVAEDNLAARALYQSLGFAQNGLRKGYYARKNGYPVDAVLMSRDMTRR